MEFWKWLAALATMNPDPPVVRSLTVVWRPLAVSFMLTTRLSPGFMNRVFVLGVNVVEVCEPGPGGPTGMPSVWRNAKLTGSSHAVLQCAKAAVHIRLSMLRAAHHCMCLQLTWLFHGSLPGG